MCAQRAKKIIYAKGGKPLMKYRTGRNNSISSNRHPAYVFEAVKEVAAQISDKTSMEFRQLMVFLCECSKRRISRRQKLKPTIIHKPIPGLSTVREYERSKEQKKRKISSILC